MIFDIKKQTLPSTNWPTHFVAARVEFGSWKKIDNKTYGRRMAKSLGKSYLHDSLICMFSAFSIEAYQLTADFKKPQSLAVSF